MITPFVFILFGATGDLANRKIMPALLSLFEQGQLGEDFFIVGFSRRAYSDNDYRTFLREKLPEKSSLANFLQHVSYQQGVFEEANGYEQLIGKLNSFDTKHGACITRIFYLATPPDNYETILGQLHATKLSEGCGQGSDTWTKIAIEKPFGKDLETARALDRKLADIFEERQIFRVDHYLGKDLVQNILAFRFANSIFDPVWNSEYIDHVQITNLETTDLSNRGSFFDGVGNLRDWGQNHLMQLVTAVAMEQPASFSRESVRDARANVMKTLRIYKPEEVKDNVIKAQFTNYQDIKGVASGSTTETYVALKIFFDTPRFQNVPFYARVGKNVDKDVVQIHVVFKQTCHVLFREFGCPEVGNVLTFTLQPEEDEGITMRFIAKRPGTRLSLDPVSMRFLYQRDFGLAGTDAYQKLLVDIFSGDQMLFNRSDELESSWAFITAILNGWKDMPLASYAPKSKGPEDAFAFIAKEHRMWIEHMDK